MIKEDIQKRIISSLKGKKETEVKVLRFVLSEIKYAEINKQKDLTDEETVSLLQKEVKKRREAIEMFKKGKRDDLVQDEEKQISIIEDYLPKQLSNEEINKIIDEILSFSGDTSNIGKIIGQVMAKIKGKADGKIVSELVKQRITSQS